MVLELTSLFPAQQGCPSLRPGIDLRQSDRSRAACYGAARGSARENIMELWELLQTAAPANVGAEPATLGWSRRRVLCHGALALGAAWAGRASAQAVGPVMAQLAAYMAAAAERTLPPRGRRERQAPHPRHLAAMMSGSELAAGPAALRFARTQGARGSATVVGSTSDAGAARRGARQRHARALRRNRRLARPVAVASRARRRAGRARARRDCGVDGRASPPRRRRSATTSVTRLTMALGGVDVPRREPPQHARVCRHVRSGRGGGCVARPRRAQQMRWLLDYASQQAAGIRGLGPRHRSHREGIRLRRHAGAQRRHRRAARPRRVGTASTTCCRARTTSFK